MFDDLSGEVGKRIVGDWRGWTRAGAVGSDPYSLMCFEYNHVQCFVRQQKFPPDHLRSASAAAGFGRSASSVFAHTNLWPSSST